MEIVRNGCRDIQSMISAVIEWRSAATAPYFMVINSAFWWSVFYLDHGTQIRLLVSLAAGVFSWDILLSSTYDRSILFHILMWPMRSVLKTIGVVMALHSAQFLYWAEFEKACWVAYGAVTLLMINPVWLYYQVPQKINVCIYMGYTTTEYFVHTAVISPLYSFYRILEYIVTLRWLIAVLEKVGKELLRVKAAINSTLSNTINSVKSAVCGFEMAVRNGVISAVKASGSGIMYAINCAVDEIIFLITFFKNGIHSGYLTLKNGLISKIILLKDFLITGFNKTKDAFCSAIIIAMDYFFHTLVTIRNSALNFFSAIVGWLRTRIINPVQNTCSRVMQFLYYWFCGHWWPDLKSCFILHVVLRLQLLLNYFRFGITYVFCGYWLNPFIAFLSRQFRRFYAYLQQSVLNSIKIWIRSQFDKALICVKQMLHNLAVRVRDSILWPSFMLLVSFMNKICVYLYRILLQPVIDVVYQKYKVCEGYLLVYCLSPVCQLFLDHIPEKSPFCDDTDTELADLLPSGFSTNEESEIEEASDKLSLPSRSLSPLPEDERDFLRGLKFPNLDTSDSSEAEFALKPTAVSKRSLKKKSKTHPKDPAPSAYSDELILTACTVQKNEDNTHNRSPSTSSHSDSALSSSLQNPSDLSDLQSLDALDFESEDHLRAEFMVGNMEIQRSGNSRDGKSKERKQNKSQEKLPEIEVCAAGQVKATTVLTSGLDDSFEVLNQ